MQGVKMDFTELRNIRQYERTNNTLYEISPKFHEDIQKFLNPEEEDIRLARSMRLCAKEILRLRFHKIVHSAMLCAETACIPNYDNLDDNEKELKKKCLDIFESWCYYES